MLLLFWKKIISVSYQNFSLVSSYMWLMTCFSFFSNECIFVFKFESIRYVMIELLNIKPGDIFDHAVILLSGQYVNLEATSIEIVDYCGNSIFWPIKDGYFKVMIKNVKILKLIWIYFSLFIKGIRSSSFRKKRDYITHRKLRSKHCSFPSTS